jgi:glycosyltransferase involved in cell wall biosynthesis
VTRVLYLIETADRGGSETALVNLIRGLKGSAFVPVLGSVGEGWLAQAAREAGAEVISLGRKSHYDGWDLTAVPRLAAVVCRHRIDLVHSLLFHMNVFGTLAAVLTGRPSICSLRSVHYDFAAWYRRAAWRVLGRFASAITAVSEHAREALCRHVGIPRQRVAVIPNGVDTSVFRPGPKRGLLRPIGIPSDAFVIGTIGRLDPVKGHAYLLDAAARVLARRPDVHFVLVGPSSGSEGGGISSRAADLGIDGRVHLVGPRDDVPDMLREFDIFVLPSLSEGMPNALLEAMATGLPCVATRVGGNSEIIGQGGVGRLVPARDAGGLAAALLSLAGDPAGRRSLGEAARRCVSTRYRLSLMVDCHKRLYAGARPWLRVAGPEASAPSARAEDEGYPQPPSGLSPRSSERPT